jgi:hypothetical protein
MNENNRFHHSHTKAKPIRIYQMFSMLDSLYQTANYDLESGEVICVVTVAWLLRRKILNLPVSDPIVWFIIHIPLPFIVAPP